MGTGPNDIFIRIGIRAVCHLPVCYIQAIYISESKRKWDGQWEQDVKQWKSVCIERNISDSAHNEFGYCEHTTIRENVFLRKRTGSTTTNIILDEQIF